MTPVEIAPNPAPTGTTFTLGETMPRFAITLLAALCACAPTATPGAPAPSQTIRVGPAAAGGSVTLNPTSNAHVSTIQLALDQVWRLLPAAFDSLGIPITTIDANGHLVSNEGVKLRQRLGKVPLSRYIECGTTQIGPNADSYDVFLSVSTQLEAAGGGESRISTTVEAAARPLAFSQEYSRCTSKGVLEARIAEAVRGQIKR
jgi:hypothetical protein